MVADSPYTANAEAELRKNLLAVEGVEFIVHLGDIKSGTPTCNRDTYETVYDMFLAIGLPFYNIIGDNEWTDCANPNKALEYWEDSFYSSYFSFSQESTQFVGVALPGGVAVDTKKFRGVYEDSTNYLANQYYFTSEYVTVFGHVTWRAGEEGSIAASSLEHCERLLPLTPRLFLLICTAMGTLRARRRERLIYSLGRSTILISLR